MNNNNNNNDTNNTKISVLTWNVLASCYIFPESYKYVKKEVLKWSRRRIFIRKILQNYNADIVCLQEVDEPGDTRKDLYELGYVNVIFEQRNGGRQDGLIIAYKATFDILLRSIVYFDEIAKSRFGILVGEERTKKHNIALIIGLKHRVTNKLVIVGNTHLYWNPNSEDVKLFQTRQFQHSLLFFYNVCERKFCFTNKMKPYPIIFACGDFNSTPNTNMVKLMTKGTMPPEKKYCKFVCDHNLRQLCRWLRALGIDAHYVNINPYIDSNNDQFQVEDLFEELYNDERVLLTTSHQLVRRRGCPPSLLISPKKDKADNLFQQIISTFNVQIKEEDFYKRCVICNHMILPLDRSQLIINNDSGVVRLPSSNNNQEKNHKSSFLNSYGMRKPNAQQQQNLSPRDHGRTDTKQDRIFKFQTENYVQNIVSSVFESDEKLFQCSGCEQIYW